MNLLAWQYIFFSLVCSRLSPYTSVQHELSNVKCTLLICGRMTNFAYDYLDGVPTGSLYPVFCYCFSAT